MILKLTISPDGASALTDETGVMVGTVTHLVTAIAQSGTLESLTATLDVNAPAQVESQRGSKHKPIPAVEE